MKNLKKMSWTFLVLIAFLTLSCNDEDDDSNNVVKSKYLSQLITLNEMDSNYAAFMYNSAKQLIKVVQKDASQQVVGVTVISYNSIGKISQMVNYSDVSMLNMVSKSSFSYTGDVLTAAVDYLETDTIYYTYEYSNNHLARIISEYTGSKTKVEFVWTGSNITKELSYYWNGTSFELSSYAINSFDAKTNPFYNLKIPSAQATYFNANNIIGGNYFDFEDNPIVTYTVSYLYSGNYPIMATYDYGTGNYVQKYSYIEL